MLRIRPRWHDEVWLYDPRTEDDAPVATGDLYPPSHDAYESLNLSFSVQRSDAPRDVMLRLDTPHRVIFEARLLPESEARRLDQGQFGWFMAYLAFILVVLISTASAWIRDGEPLLGAASINIAIGVSYAASMYGVLRLLLNGTVPSASLNAFNNLLILVYPISTMVFYRFVLKVFAVRRLGRVVLDLFISVGAAALLASLLGFVHGALFWNSVTISLSIAWVLIAMWFLATPTKTQVSDDLPFWIVRLVATGLLGFTLFGLITGTLGFYVDWGARIEAFLLHTSVVSVLLSAGLQYRSRRRLRALALAERRANLASLERERMQRFMSMFSHEVRTPLSIVNLAVEQGIRDPLLADQAQGAIADLDRLVSKSLEVDRLESTDVVNDREEVDLVELVEDCALRIQLHDALRWGKVQPTWVHVDVHLTHVIVTNLLENAVKYGASRAEIDVDVTSTPAGKVFLAVGNRIDGEGMFDPSRVFEKYYRGDFAARRSGAGLGLYLAREFARAQGGDLNVEGPRDSYVRFILEVPA